MRPQRDLGRIKGVKPGNTIRKTARRFGKMNGLKPLGAIRASTAMLLCCAMLLLGGAAGYTIRGTQQVQIQPPPEETAQEVPAQPEKEPQAGTSPDAVSTRRSSAERASSSPV